MNLIMVRNFRPEHQFLETSGYSLLTFVVLNDQREEAGTRITVSLSAEARQALIDMLSHR